MPGSVCKGLIAAAKCGDENPSFSTIAGSRVHDADSVAGIIDEAFLSSTVFPREGDTKLLHSFPIVLAELAVQIPFGISLSVGTREVEG